MGFDAFCAELDDLESNGAARSEMAQVLSEVDESKRPDYVSRYVRKCLQQNSRTAFISTLIVISGVALSEDDVFALVARLKSEGRREDSDIYEAIRLAVSHKSDLVSQLLRTFILDSNVDTVQPDLLAVFPEHKLHDASLYLDSVKRCAVLPGQDPQFAGFLSSVIVDLPPSEDEGTVNYVRQALATFDDRE